MKVTSYAVYLDASEEGLSGFPGEEVIEAAIAPIRLAVLHLPKNRFMLRTKSQDDLVAALAILTGGDQECDGIA